ncbi:hypothetical protein KN815_24705 [Streptomyces sp. 4503]|uniref:Uncharacterized protein n=1 Tax=Streptomyces niphimycinicus TaxID=2842201 RepID=A0ABS6CJM3_9ACTN|nr:hypothetical protein [Streptomyces niphimycinicus]MBU3867141.1 hypothetical protein [Streptomyces niphimycinicus]
MDPLAGRERSLPGIALALLAGRFGLHLIFSLGQGSTAPLWPTVPAMWWRWPNGSCAVAMRRI